MRHNIGIVLVFAGLLVVCAPQISEMVYNHKQKELLKQWELAMSQQLTAPEIIEPADKSEPEPVEAVPKPVEEISEPPVNQSPKKDTLNPKPKASDLIGIGVLKIDSINLEVPVLKGTTRANLNTAVTTVEPTGQPGDIGNFAIAGHNNYEYGRNFNRLGEVEVGNNIQIHTQYGVFNYNVTEIFYVKPDETWVLYGQKGKSLITLITCYPRRSATERLIVRGQLQEEKEIIDQPEIIEQPLDAVPIELNQEINEKINEEINQETSEEINQVPNDNS